MKLSGTAEFIASRNWDKVPLPNGEWEESNDQDEKKPWILPERVRLFIVFLDLLYNLIPLYEGKKVESLQKPCMDLRKIAMEMFLL